LLNLSNWIYTHSLGSACAVRLIIVRDKSFAWLDRFPQS